VNRGHDAAVSDAENTRSTDAALWVFGYGSLIWRPGFAFIERHPATLSGYHRSLCVYSHVHRGTPERPGLVFGLDRGGSCRGMAFKVLPQDRDAVIGYLREREQVTSVYLERHISIRIDGSHRQNTQPLTAMTYVVDRQHRQYAGRLEREKLLQMVRQAAGISGHNPDYVRETHRALRDMGVNDSTVGWLAGQLGPAI
jgi:glutathione-specific gamma-glutamylcyclotransferase